MTATADRRFLQRLALDVLQRSLGLGEVRAYLGASLQDVVPRVMGSLEAMQVWLDEQLYYFLLLDNFRPGSEAVARIPQRLRSGELTAHGALAEILLSTGFSLRNPGNDTFVTVVLEQCLGLQVQDRRVARILEAGKEMYDGRRVRFLGEQGESQADLIRIALGHEDCTRLLLDRHHRKLLGQELAQSAKAEAWVQRVHAEPRTFFALLQEWVLSPGYRDALSVRRPRDDRQFVRALYMDLLERLPSGQELRNMRNAMQSMADPAPLRSVMAKVILDSRQARLPSLQQGREEDFVAACFRRYLCREPGGTELAEFAATLREGGSARHVVRALIGSPEYQYY